MAKIKLTKGELKRQRDALSQFRHYLPTLQLKKQQLQIKIWEIRKNLGVKETELKNKIDFIEGWVGLLGEASDDLKKCIEIKRIVLGITNIAGANLPVFESVEFDQFEYNFYQTPLWYDKGILSLKEAVALIAEAYVIKEQLNILERELRITTQRANLFEKVKIPECLENIRKIRIYLGDQLANAVGTGKVAKKKIEARELAGVLT